MSTEQLKQLVADYLKKKGQLLICLSGLSGAGKTYHAKQLSQLLDLQHLDQDDFFKDSFEMPDMTFSNGMTLKNWDCQESLDLDQMNKVIDQKIKNGIIFSGFACRDKWFSHVIDVQIHLKIDEKTCYLR